MSADLELIGMDRILKRVEEMGKAGKKVESNALKISGELLLGEMRSILLSNNHYRTGELEHGLSVGPVRKKYDMTYVQIGIQKGDISNIFYGKFIEWGTSKMNASPFMSVAYINKKNEAKQVIMTELKRGLGL